MRIDTIACFCVISTRERKRERERGREREREGEKEGGRERQTETGRQTDRHVDTQTHIHALHINRYSRFCVNYQGNADTSSHDI